LKDYQLSKTTPRDKNKAKHETLVLIFARHWPSSKLFHW